MITFILILVFLDSLQFGAEPTPKLRHMPVVVSPQVINLPPPCPVDAKKRRIHCPE